jgi:hypothetical protein
VAGDDETPAKIARAAPTVTPYFDAIRRKLKWGARSQSKENNRMRMKFTLTSAGAVLVSVVSFAAQALPLSPEVTSGYGQPFVTQVAGGCGPAGHRGPYGGCRYNRGPVVVVPGAAAIVAEPVAPVVVGPAVAPAVVVAPIVCPPRYHLGPRGRACRLN